MVVGDIPSGTEVAVIGAGPGGYVAALRAAQLGMDTTLIERDAFGGTCLNYGCIPSKALISATSLAHAATTADELGITADVEVDYGTMVGWKDSVVDELTSGVERLCAASGVTLVSGTATFTGERSLRILRDGGSETLQFEYAIIATGSHPVEIPGFSFTDEPVLDSREALEMTTPPERLVIVGAGYIGMELATVFARLGTEVSVVEALDDALPGYEPDVTAVVKGGAEELGIEFHFGQRATEWRPAEDGITVVTETDAGEPTEHDADNVLVAVGRVPVVEPLNLEALGVHPNRRGFLETDERGRTDRDEIFAIGDVAGEPMLAHKAMKEGRVAAEVIAGEPSALDYQAIPAVVFTEPEVGTVGLTETAATEDGYSPRVGQFPFSASGRALTATEPRGFVRLIADEGSGLLLGGQIVGPEASELIAEVTLAVEMGATVEDLAATIHTHPTLGEAVMEAAENALGRSIHVRNR